ncbi:hypothetical protein G6F60_015021 [Rhizopus arrhizus]|nr:hypothetical protein G6F60_015021 [Rhizopus arrhizus]
MACSDAAEAAGLPFVVTSSLAYSPDTTAPYVNVDMFNMHHPTSKGLSFFTRLNDKQNQPRKEIDWPQGHNGPNGLLEGLYQDCE